MEFSKIQSEKGLYQYGDTFDVGTKIQFGSTRKRVILRLPKHISYNTMFGVGYESSCPEKRKIDEIKKSDDVIIIFDTSTPVEVGISYKANAISQDFFPRPDTSTLTEDIERKANELTYSAKTEKDKFERIFSFVSSLPFAESAPSEGSLPLSSLFNYDRPVLNAMRDFNKKNGDESVLTNDFELTEEIPPKITNLIDSLILRRMRKKMKVWQQKHGPYFLIETSQNVPSPFIFPVKDLTRFMKKGRGTCRDYALLLYTMCNSVGIASNYVGGWTPCDETEKELYGHAWNEVMLDDEWLPVDASWELVGDVPHYLELPQMDVTIEYKHLTKNVPLERIRYKKMAVELKNNSTRIR